MRSRVDRSYLTFQLPTFAGLVGLSLALATASHGQVTYQSKSGSTVNSGTSMTIAKPVGTSSGDLLIAAVAVDDIGGGFSGTGYSAPGGWTVLNQGTCPLEPPRRCTMSTWWKIAGGSEPADYTFGWDSSDEASGAILRYSGTDQTDPIGEVTTLSGVDKANSPNRPKAPSITTTVANSVVLRILGNDREGGTWGGGAGHITRHNECNTESDPSLVCLTMADIGQATPGTLATMNWEPAPSLSLIFWRSLSIEIIPPQPKGDIEVFKHTLPDGDGELFDFTATGLMPSTFDLMDDESQLFAGLLPGSGLYSVSEVVPPDWTRISYCDVGFPGNVEVVDGMTTECHFVNVDETQVPRCDMVGRPDNGSGAGGFLTAGWGLLFDARAPFVLRAVHVYPNSAGSVVVNLEKDGFVVASRSVAVDPAFSGQRTRVELDLPVPAGSGYEINAAGSTTGGLYRNSSGASYPYAGEFVEISGNTFGNSSYYYYLYDWEVERMDAVGPSTKEFGVGGYNKFGNRVYFDVAEPTRLHAVHVYAGTAGDVVIELRNGSGVVLETVTRSIPTGLAGVKTPLVLDLLLPSGTGYSLNLNTTGTTATLWRNQSGSVYPFTTSSLTITGTSNPSPGFHYYFYDWLFTPARVGWDVQLDGLTIDGALTVRACETATLGPDLDLVFPADLDVKAGERILLESPFEAGDNSLMRLATDPSLLPD